MSAIQINDVEYKEIDGKMTAVPVAEFMVESRNDLDGITGVAAGTIAYTAGFQAMWQLAANGTWVSVF